MVNLAKKWYTVLTVSGKEEKVIELLKNHIVSENSEENFDLKNGFKVMFVPHILPRELDKKKQGNKYITKKINLYKGHIFVKMNMTNDSWFVIRNTQYVSGIIGSSGQGAKPTPISNLEMQKMEKKVVKIIEEFNHDHVKSEFEINQVIEIIDGPAKGQTGKILKTNDKKGVAIIELILFERKTPTEVPYKNLIIKS